MTKVIVINFNVRDIVSNFTLKHAFREKYSVLTLKNRENCDVFCDVVLRIMFICHL